MIGTIKAFFKQKKICITFCDFGFTKDIAGIYFRNRNMYKDFFRELNFAVALRVIFLRPFFIGYENVLSKTQNFDRLCLSDRLN